MRLSATKAMLERRMWLWWRLFPRFMVWAILIYIQDDAPSHGRYDYRSARDPARLAELQYARNDQAFQRGTFRFVVR